MAHTVAKAESGLQYINRNDRHRKEIPRFMTDRRIGIHFQAREATARYAGTS